MGWMVEAVMPCRVPMVKPSGSQRERISFVNSSWRWIKGVSLSILPMQAQSAGALMGP